MTSTPACTIAYCPKPTDPDFHRCVLCGSVEVQHHHTEGRIGTRKMRKKSVICLCQPHHDFISLNEWHDFIIYTGESQEPDLYCVLDLHGKTVAQRKLSSGKEVMPNGVSDTALQSLRDEPRSTDQRVGEGEGAGLPIATSKSERRRFTAQGATFIDKAPGEPPEDAEQGEAENPPGNTALPAVREPAPIQPASDSPGWTALALSTKEDEVLAHEFTQYLGAAGVLQLEAYRRIEAFRLKYEGIAGEKWVEGAADVFGLKASTLFQYARAWRAFEDQADASQYEISESLREMGGGVWSLIARQPSQVWPAMTELALSVVADTGPGRGLVARVAARAAEEGVAEPSKVTYRCPECGVVKKLSEFREAT